MTNKQYIKHLTKAGTDIHGKDVPQKRCASVIDGLCGVIAVSLLLQCKITKEARHMQANKCYYKLLIIKSFPPSCRRVDSFQKQHKLIPSQLIKPRRVRLAEHLAADTADLHALVIYNIAATLPVEKLHQRAAAVEEHVHAAVGRFSA